MTMRQVTGHEITDSATSSPSFILEPARPSRMPKSQKSNSLKKIQKSQKLSKISKSQSASQAAKSSKMSKAQQDLEVAKLSAALLDSKSLKKSRKFARKSRASRLHDNSHSAATETFAAITTPTPPPDMQSSPILDSAQVASYQELVSALSAKIPRIILTDNIIAADNILINYDVAINFNGFSIISEESRATARVLDIRSGTVTLTGHGKVFAMGPHSVAIRAFGAISSGVPHYTTIVIGEGISLFAPDAYGILVSPNLGVAYGLTIDFAGKIFAHDGICIASGIRGLDQHLPQINVNPGAIITADEQSGTAIEASGYGEWEISAARLRGAVGINATAGIIKLIDSQVHTTNLPNFYLVDSSESTLKISIDGGTYISEASPIVDGSPSPLKKIVIKGAHLCTPVDPAAAQLENHITLKNITTHTDVAQFLAAIVESEPEPTPTQDSEPIPTPASDSETTHQDNSTPTRQDYSRETLDFEEAEPALASAPSLIESLAMVPSSEPASHQISAPIIPSPTSSASLSDWLSLVPELTDAETDEAEIVSALTASKRKKKTSRQASKSPLPEPPIPSVDIEPSAAPLSPNQSTPSEAVSILASEAVPTLTSEVTSVSTPETITMPAAPAPLVPETPVVVPTQIIAPGPEFPVEIPNITPEPETPVEVSNLMSELPTAQPSETNDEQFSARAALSDALTEIRKLRREDYIDGFNNLETIIRESESILRNPDATLAEICDAAGNLLQAFDSLEERDEFSLTDDELDELFYHGAILEEMASHSKKSKRTKTSKSSPSPLPESIPSSSDFHHNIYSNNLTLKPPVRPIHPPSEQSTKSYDPDFSVISELLTTISELNLQDYSLTSRTALLASLDRAHAVLINPDATQGAIDEVTANLLAEFSRLEPQSASHSAPSSVKLSSPVPVVGRILLPTMIDEMTPTSIWSQGVTMIDEMTPFITDSSTREKMLRAMRPVFSAAVETIIQPFKKLVRSFMAGTRAGLNAYRETLHAK